MRSLEHEIRVAGALSLLGYDVLLNDLAEETAHERLGTFDFLAERNGVEFEVDAKWTSTFTGIPMLPEDTDKLFREARRLLRHRLPEQVIPVVRIIFTQPVTVRQNDLAQLVDVCSRAITEQWTGGQPALNGVIVEYDCCVPATDTERLKAVVEIYSLRHSAYVYASFKKPNFVMCLFSERRNILERKIATTISSSANRQFSKRRPAIIWTHIEYLSDNSFEKCIIDGSFGRIARRALCSEKRGHIKQLIFSGAAFADVDGQVVRNAYRQVVYNKPNAQRSEEILFPNGKEA